MTEELAAGAATAANSTHRPKQRSRRWRSVLRVVHIIVAIGALATDAILLTLAITGLAAGDADLIRAAYLTMDLLASVVLIPLALATLLTGILLGWSSSWGIARYYWVLTKLILALTAATAAVFVLRPTLNEAAAAALGVSLADLPSAGIGQIAARAATSSAVGVSLLTTAALLAFYKPWGRIRLRRR
jgi:hypothetical protein